MGRCRRATTWNQLRDQQVNSFVATSRRPRRLLLPDLAWARWRCPAAPAIVSLNVWSGHANAAAMGAHHALALPAQLAAVAGW